MTALEKLLPILPPPKTPHRADNDWPRIENELGLTLPSDYKAFISRYGTGEIGNGLLITNPFNFEQDVRTEWINFASMYRSFAEYGGATIPYPIFPESGGLLPFGSLADFTFLNWLTVGEPDNWPFVFYDRDREFFEIKGLSAADFILEAVTQKSPLMTLLNSDVLFNPPCEFDVFVPNTRYIRLVSHGPFDLNSLAEQISMYWPTGQSRVFRRSPQIELAVETFNGKVTFSPNDGNEYTWITVSYDPTCQSATDDFLKYLADIGFEESGRW